MPITIIKDIDALEKSDDISDKRELHLERLETVPLKVEYQDPLAWNIFNKMPRHILPPLPLGYQWARVNSKYSVIREEEAKSHELLLVLYGPNKEKVPRINLIFQVDGVTTYSFAHTSSRKGPGPKDEPPMSCSNYAVPGYNYSAHGYKSHVRGHLVDRKDTITEGPEKSWSTNDPRNYVPEPPDYGWGLGFRRLKVKELRASKGEGAYAQFNIYPRKPLLTKDKTPVPEDVYFYPYSLGTDYNYILEKNVFSVEWNESFKRPEKTTVLGHAAATFVTSSAASPVVKIYDAAASDRALRADLRACRTQIDKIASREIVSRFPAKDGLYAHQTAAAGEFERIDSRFSAGLFASNNKNSQHAKFHFRGALSYGEGLVEFDAESAPFDDTTIMAGNQFFKAIAKMDGDDIRASVGGLDLEDLKDRFRRIV